MRAHNDVFRLSAAALMALQLRRDYIDALGTHHLSWQTMVKGVPVFGNGLQANVTRSGRLLSVLGSPLATVPRLATAPRLSAAKARGIAAHDVGGQAAAATAKTRPGARRATTWSNHDAASLVVFRTPSAARLGWLTYVQAGESLTYQHVVDASSGRVLYRADLAADDNGDSWSSSSSTGMFRIETSPDGTTYTTAAEGTFTSANCGHFNVVTPTAGASGVQYVKFWMLSPQVPDFANNCPAGNFGGCTFTDMTEIEVFGPPSS